MGNVLKIVAGICVFVLSAYYCWRHPHVAGVGEYLWCLLGSLAGGTLIGSGWRGLGVQQREREQALFFQGKVEAAIRESDMRGLRVKTVEARLRNLPATIRERIVEIDRPVIVAKVVEVDRPVVIERLIEVEKSVPIPVPVPAAEPRERLADDMELIHGVGPKLARLLNDRGITQFRQVALWTDADIDGFEAELSQFKGRIRREGWVRSAAEQHRAKYGRDA